MGGYLRNQEDTVPVPATKAKASAWMSMASRMPSSARQSASSSVASDGDTAVTANASAPRVRWAIAASRYFSATPGRATASLRYPEDVVVWAGSAAERSAVNAEIVFVGYGSKAPEYNWDDFKGVDVRGKTIVVLVNDPQVPDAGKPGECLLPVVAQRTVRRRHHTHVHPNRRHAAESHDLALLERAVAWLAAQDGVASVITGATTPEQVRAAVESLRVPHAGNPEGGGWVTVSLGVATALARAGDDVLVGTQVRGDDLRVTQIVNGNKGVHVMMEKTYL